MVVKIEDVTDKADRKFLTIIREHGWHVMHVHNTAEETGPEFSYSTGIYEKFGKPEIIIFGLAPDLRKSIINGYGNDVTENQREFHKGEFYEGFLEGFDVYLTEGNTKLKKEYACWTDWYYERQSFPLLQCVWPSTSGVWPWDDNASAELKDIQPIFGPIPQENNL